MTITHKNQINPPTPKKKREDNKGNEYKKLWIRDGKTTTMLFCNGLTENGCKAMINAINNAALKLGIKPLSNRFFISR